MHHFEDLTHLSRIFFFAAGAASLAPQPRGALIAAEPGPKLEFMFWSSSHAPRSNFIFAAGATSLGPHFVALPSLQNLNLGDDGTGTGGAAALGPHFAALQSPNL
jgi:hypothetical protein